MMIAPPENHRNKLPVPPPPPPPFADGLTSEKLQLCIEPTKEATSDGADATATSPSSSPGSSHRRVQFCNESTTNDKTKEDLKSFSSPTTSPCSSPRKVKFSIQPGTETWKSPPLSPPKSPKKSLSPRLQERKSISGYRKSPRKSSPPRSPVVAKSKIQIAPRPRPDLTIYHKTYEMILRDSKNRVCAVVMGWPKSSRFGTGQQQQQPQPRQYKIYGVSPIHTSQRKVQKDFLGKDSQIAKQLLKAEIESGTPLDFYEWATIQSKKKLGGALLLGRKSQNLELSLQFVAETKKYAMQSNSSTMKKNSNNPGSTSLSSSSSTASPRIRSYLQQQRDQSVESTTIRLEHSISQSTVRNGSGIQPGMDPHVGVFFLACAEEFISYLCLTMK